MIDDFKQIPERQPTRLDPNRGYRQRTASLPNASTSPTPLHIDRSQPRFRTPEEVAGSIPVAIAPPETVQPTGLFEPDELLLPAHATPDKKKSFLSGTVRLFRRWDVSKKKILLASVVALLLIGGSSGYALTRDQPAPAKPVAKAKVVVKPAPKPITSPLTGMPVIPSQQTLPVIGVMVENSPNARPQSGLKDAGVVYEAIAEAGITRFLALFQESHPGNVGPIRSARPYYLDWALAFDASYAHVGGSPDALQRIKDLGVRDLDQFFNPAAYRRITTRFAPHNVYTSIDDLTNLSKAKGYETSTFTGFARKAEQPYKPAASTTTPPTPSAPSKPAAEARTAANTIDLGISGPYYNAQYAYDAATNSYKRNMAGTPHMDADSNTQLAPKVVIALAMQYGLMADGYHSAYTTQGSGKMYVFQDGTVTTGTWTKGDPKSQFEFKDDAGKVIALNPGQTWLSVVSDAAKVTYR
ncbi:MAG TPA: DUF3048 domain-containing protein [Candidatus Saccharimonadales bacterium]|jgi:hypothetical protein